MKHFAIAIKAEDDQSEISKLLSNLGTEVQEIEKVGGVVSRIYLNYANKHETQTEANVYYQSDVPIDDYDEAGQQVFEREGESAVAAFTAVNELLQQWVSSNRPSDIYDVKFDFYIGEGGKDIAVATIFYEP